MGFWTSLGVTWSIQGRQGDGFIFAVSASVWVGSKFPGCNFGAGCGSQGPVLGAGRLLGPALGYCQL